ncbi:MAG: transport system ATP-binding/permease protein [Solirubrobacterales bacterium]|nr:transport system ATP-binding/permease protein [Solirubrobacterales bacterium]
MSTVELLHAGGRAELGDELRLGSAGDNDVVLADERASRHHARIRRDNGDFTIDDLGSRHGTYVNGERLGTGGRVLAPGDSIEIGDQRLRFLGGQETRVPSGELPSIFGGIQPVVFGGERLSIGRDPANDVVLADPNVSRFHAELVCDGDAFELTDLGSRNGTRLDGEPVTTRTVDKGSEIGIGPYRLVFDGASLLARDDHGALRLDAREVAVSVGDKRILEPTSLSIEPGELVAIIGESGAGKSTLLRALAGVTPPSRGRVTLNGEDLLGRLTDVGYVPQDDIVHALLTVREALAYAARLRLPEDVSGEEVDAAVARVLGELSLAEHAETMIGSLSGGQRKRTGVATELLNRPSVLFLDEPTTGLDPGLETQLMTLFRELSRAGRAIAIVTHATKNLELCDRVVVMGRGGVLTFDGPPSAAKEFFGVGDYDGIYTALPDREPREWRTGFEATRSGPGAIALPPEHVAVDRRRRAHLLPQLRVLTGRYLRLFLRDRRNLLLLLGQAPVLALFGVALFESGILDRGGGNGGDAVNMLFLMAITVIWLGAIDAAPEIVKERAVVEREFAVGARVSAYLASKLIVLIGLVAVQTLLYAGVLLAFRPLDSSLTAYATVLGLLVATGIASVTMGLLVSALVRTQDQAMSLIPLAVIPQLLFAGAIVPLDRMAEPARILAEAIFAQWALAGIGTAVDMSSRLASDPEFANVNRFGDHFFDLAAGPAFAVQGGFAVVFLSATALMLRRSLRP